MKIEIVQAGNPVLRQRARQLSVAEIRSREMQKLIEAMRTCMHEAPGVGLAAPQLGLALQLAVIEDREEYHKDVSEALLAERDYLRARLERSALVAKVWPSDTNFLLVDSEDADRFLRLSMAGGTLVRDLRASPALPSALRISVGTRAENDALIQSLEAA